ncbi:hypothetical protein ADK70_01990 [Streptomyces rimosus subsp. pseudoverticillatus]|uniref:hypothetical protein n=1 Tax=Streptomyces rimosus TaxID=1927 RepID=UPI0006B2833F|nr:hypothetical protein [Streptomyces rimosus]KOT99896.1 hypothetical protein ADK70_01990 [Streptomyces rimosus subsp. pseudoverticillatus]
MRLRTSVAAAFGAAVLALTTPTSAYGAVGVFSYGFNTGDKLDQRAALFNPPGKECITLKLPKDADFAYAALNHTNATVTLFADDDCSSDVYFVVPPHKAAPERVLLRSVMFSR